MPDPLDRAARPEPVADMVLRGPNRKLRARVRWPMSAPAAAAPALAVLLLRHDGSFVSGVEPLEATLALVLGVVVVSVSIESLAEAKAAVEWVADHAAELGADPTRLVVAADGASVDLAGAVTRQARDEGWPSLPGIVLVPTDDAVRLAAPAARPEDHA